MAWTGQNIDFPGSIVISVPPLDQALEVITLKKVKIYAINSTKNWEICKIKLLLLGISLNLYSLKNFFYHNLCVI